MSLRAAAEAEFCPDCGVEAGRLHQKGCDVERCLICGHQFLSCGCIHLPSDERDKWSGEWPGRDACREMGLWCYFADDRTGKSISPGQPGRWTPCEKNHPDATEDLNRLHVEMNWDRVLKRWVKPN